MRAFVTSIGEKTTQVCCEQLKRFGFDVILLDKKEDWLNKYKRFILLANEDCLRIDADVIPNKHIKEAGKEGFGMVTYTTYDFYRNDIGVTSPVFYRKDILMKLKKRIKDIPAFRPETSASRFPEINKEKFHSSLIVGIHGFGADKEMIDRAKKNKTERGQMKEYDFDLAFNLMKLYDKR